MSRKSRSLVKVSGISIALMFMMSGCGIKDMSDSQMKVIANYAADVLIRYDASYYEKFAGENKKNQSQEEDNIVADNETVVPEITTEPAVVTETPQAEETVQADAQATPDNTVVQQGNVADNDVSPMDIGELFGLKDVEISYTGCEMVQQYPDASDGELAFQVSASDNHKLLVFSFELVNTSSESRNCNILGQNVKFRMTVNDTDNISVMKTLLLDDLSQMNVVLQPMESKKGVVICQVPADYNADVNSLSMVIRTGGEDHTIKLK